MSKTCCFHVYISSIATDIPGRNIPSLNTSDISASASAVGSESGDVLHSTPATCVEEQNFAEPAQGKLLGFQRIYKHTFVKWLANIGNCSISVCMFNNYCIYFSTNHFPPEINLDGSRERLMSGSPTAAVQTDPSKGVNRGTVVSYLKESFVHCWGKNVLVLTIY